MLRSFTLSTSVSHHALAALSMLLLAPAVVTYFAPATYMFEATLEVPDFKVGEEAKVLYTRKIKLTQKMGWGAEVRAIGEVNRQFCQGEGQSLYEVSEPAVYPMSLARFVGLPTCSLPEGSYTLHACWFGQILWFDKTYCTQSNIFRVLPT